MAVHFADEAVCIGPPPAAKSYLNIETIIAAAQLTGAGAIHPGYGFLSENARFAQAVGDAGIVFVGPAPETIRTMGDKAAARAAAKAAGVPIVPGSEGEVGELDHALAAARQIGFPVMLKASAGGGGRGIRVAVDEAQFEHQFHTAQAEAKAAFGSGALYLERFLNRARHLEVQVLGDGERVVHCFERECSLQRRRQKIWEEAPSPAIDDVTRQTLCASAVRLAERAGYRGAGTLEYLYDDDTGEFFFIEMNTRIQVEHPVTEMITGIDLVREMIRIAQGEPLSLTQADVQMRGAAIEVRINAEDPDKNFRPSPGRVAALTLPAGPGVRVDSMLFPGYIVPPYYDSLLAKIIVHAETRDHALARLRRALDELEIEGIVTTAPLHKRLARLAEVQTARFDTGFLERLPTA
jgi:acetyl-CoA carboxylase biotin carboxylase subunit